MRRCAGGNALAKTLMMSLVGLTAAAQTRIDLSTQARKVDFSNASSTKPVQMGTALPSACVVGQMYFKSNAPAGANLYACTSTNSWVVQGGISGANCWADAGSGTLRCQDQSGNTYTVVQSTTGPISNQWVDYIEPNGTAHTSQPTAAAVGAVGDPGRNGIPYRSGAGSASAATADQMSGPFFCQDAGTSGAYSCALTPPISGYVAGTTYWFRANTANSGAATLNLNGLGAKAIVKQAAQPLTANDIRAGQWVMVTYDGANLQMQSQTGAASEPGLGNPPANGYVLSSNTSGIRSWVPNGSGGTMIYPGTGLAMSTGAGWATSLTPGPAGHTVRSNGTVYTDSAIQASDIPTLNQNTTGNAATATALANTPPQCSGGQFATGITASGTANCSAPTAAQVGLGSVTNDAQTRAAVVPNSAPAAGQILTGNASGAYTPVTVSGDGGLSASGVLTISKSGGTPFGTAAFQNTGTSGGSVPLLSGNNTWSGVQTFLGCMPVLYTASGSIAAYSTVVLNGTSVSTAGSSGGPVAGVAQQTVSNGQQVQVCSTGLSNVVMDGNAAQGNVAVASTITGGRGWDSGWTSRNAVPLQTGVLGTITTGCTGIGCTAVVALEGMNRTGRQVLSSYLPATISSNTSGNAATATALAAMPSQCSGGQFATGVTASGSANCATPTGGSGGTTALTPAGDANYTMLSTDRTVYHSAMTATRTDTLPAANSVANGTSICEIDKMGLLNSSVTLKVAPHGSDTINGGPSGPQLQTTFAGACFLTDGASNWTVTNNAASIVSGYGVLCSLVSGVVQCSTDSSVMLTRLQAATWLDLTVVDTGASGTAYAGCPSGVTPPLTAYMEVELVPAHVSAGGATTFNYCGTGATPLYEADGATNLVNSDLTTGQKTALWLDANSHWRLKTKSGGGGGSGVSTFSGDGSLISNNGSTGGVTVALGAAGAHKFWGNDTGTTATPGYESITAADLPGAGSATVNGQACTLGAACTIPLSAMNPQSTTYQVSTLDFSNYKTITVASGTFSITLAPNTSQPANGQYINILNYGSGTVTVARSGQNLNGGAGVLTLPAGSAASPVSVTVWSDGANYFSSAIAGQIPANLRARGIGMMFSGGGSTLSAGTTYYLTTPFACTISGWNMTADTGTATVDIWKVATGTAIPTASNSITAGAQPAISSGTAAHGTTLTGWTTAVAANDIWGFNLKAVSGATVVSLVVECDQ